MKRAPVVLIVLLFAFDTFALSSQANFSAEMKRLEKAGTTGYSKLVKTAFDVKETMASRWRSLTLMGALGREKSIPELERALQDREWYMRDAALRILPQVDSARALVWSKKLMQDPSLIVRTSAVQNLKLLEDRSSRDLLWEKLYAPENFRGTQSLWVRRHIADALARLADKGDEQKLCKILEDTDVSLYPHAIQALERVTGQKLGEAKDSVNTRRALWKNWIAKNTL